MNETDLHAQNITLKAQHTRMVRKYEQQIESLQREIERLKFRKNRPFTPPTRDVELERVLEVVSQVTGIDPVDILSHCRKQEFVIARQLMYYFGRYATGAKFQRLGLFIGGRDHSTAMNGLKQIEDGIAIKRMPEWKYFNEIKEILTP